MPLSTLLGLWHSPNRGRALLLAIPSLFVAIILMGTLLWAWIGTESGIKRNYERAAQDAVAKAAQANRDGDEDLSKKQLNRAKIYWTKLVEIEPEELDYKFELFQIALAERDLALSRTLLKGLAPRDNPGHARAHIFRADTAIRQALLTKTISPLDFAQSQLDLALGLEPNNVEANIKLADLNFQKGNLEEALEIYKRYREEFPVFIFKIVRILGALDRLPEATPLIEDSLEDYRRMAEQYPENFPLWERFVRCYVLLRQFPEAEQILVDKRETLESAEDKVVLDNLISQVNYFWAMDMLIGMEFLSAAQRETRFESHLGKLAKALRLDSSSLRVRRQLTILGSSNRTIALAARQLYDPRNSPDTADVTELQIAGSYEVLNGDRQLGIQLLEAGLERAPDNHVILNNLAYSIRQSDPERALEFAEKAVQLDPNQVGYRDTRGHIYMIRRQYEKAIGDFREVEKRRPEEIKLLEAIEACFRQVNLERDANIYRAKIERLEARRPQQNDPSQPGNNN